ncbi:hypothetical protein C414_000220053 [Campylobacter jejuni subsp. jejuni 414]|nr:hypothetical protein C414_000220053 [Campylobacter jejuni subsp. jejuni 414]
MVKPNLQTKIKSNILLYKAGANQSGELKFIGDTAQKASLGDGYSFDLTADKLTFTGIANQEAASIIATNGASTINAKNGVELSNANIDVANGAYFNRNLNGSLAINGDLKLTSSSVANFGNANFNVNGKVTASNTEFEAVVLDLSRVTSDGFYIMSASGGFVNGSDATKSFTDASSGNKGLLNLRNPLVNISSNLVDRNYAGGVGTIANFDIIAPSTNLSNLYGIELVQKGNSLFMSVEVFLL